MQLRESQSELISPVIDHLTLRIKDVQSNKQLTLKNAAIRLAQLNTQKQAQLSRLKARTRTVKDFQNRLLNYNSIKQSVSKSNMTKQSNTVQEIDRIIQQTLQETQRHQNDSNTDSQAKPTAINTSTMASKKCDVKLHIKQCLVRPDLANKNSILKNLQSQLNLRMKQVSTALQKQEPYLHGKMLSSIHQQVKCAGKWAMAKRIQEHFKSLQDGQSQLLSQKGPLFHNTSISAQFIAQMMAQNINSLKEIQKKKILNNDRIYSSLEKIDSKITLLKNSCDGLMKTITLVKNVSEDQVVKQERTQNAKRNLVTQQIFSCYLKTQKMRRETEQEVQTELSRLQKALGKVKKNTQVQQSLQIMKQEVSDLFQILS